VPTIVSTSPSIPIEVPFPVLSIGAGPFSDGGADPTLRLVSCVASTAANGMPRLEFMRAYGKVKQPWQSDFVQPVAPLDLVGKWVTFKLFGPGGSSSVLWHGKITTGSKTIQGNSTATGPTGEQHWTAYGPLQLLLKSTVGGAAWLSGSAVAGGDVARSFNLKDSRGMILGNRSAGESGGTYVFGGTATWTRLQAINYLLARFTGAAFGGETWTVTGNTQILDASTGVVEIGDGDSVGEVLAGIISPQFGLDYHIVRSSGAFELRVFSLAVESSTYLGINLPKNTRRVTIAAGNRTEFVRTRIDRAVDQRYSKIVVRGARIIVCFTLRASDGTLVKKWSTADEATYKAGSGGCSVDPPKRHDRARQDPSLGGVFTLFGVPDDFQMADVAAAAAFDQDGTLSGMYSEHQNTRRSTLPWIPLRENVDYRPKVPVDTTPGEHQSDFTAPMVWLREPSTRIVDTFGGPEFDSAEFLGYAVSMSNTDWGFRVSASPPHDIALNHWSGAEGSMNMPYYDYSTLQATVAVEMDRRVSLVQTRQDGDGTSLVIDVPGAELWILAAGTAVGTNDDDRNLITRDDSYLLRDDRDDLRAVMASALARYFSERWRADVAIKGLHPWSASLGDMLSAIQQGGSNTRIGAPITSVTYVGGDNPETIVRAGYS